MLSSGVITFQHERFPSVISCETGVLAANILNICLPKKDFFESLKHIFACYRILSRQDFFFPFSTFNVTVLLM